MSKETRQATSFSAEELNLLNILIKLMLSGGNPIVIPGHLVRHKAFGTIAGKITRMHMKAQHGADIGDEPV